MKQHPFFLYVLLGIGTAIWLLCLVQVVFAPKKQDADVYVSPSVHFSSAYKGNSLPAFRSLSSHRSSLPAIVAQAPKSVMHSTSHAVSGSTMRIATTSSQRVQEIYTGGYGAPSASNNTGSASTRGITYSSVIVSIPMPQVTGFTTSASVVRDGTTSSETYARMNNGREPASAASRRMALPPGVCDHCHWVQDAYGNWYCANCGASALDGCDCDEHGGYCWCPVGDGWQVWMFMALLAVGYAYRRRTQLS